MQRTLDRWYLESDFVPKEIILPIEPEQKVELICWLKEKREKSLEIIVPKLGDKKKLVSLASSNAEYLLREYLIALSKREQTIPRAVMSLQRDLRLPKPPLWIECFDNSHIQGSEIVSSMVVFADGKPKKSEYRKYKIKSVNQNDDFSSMKEVVYRRYKRLLDENKKLPDLIVIDGGKGQLSSALDSLKALNIHDKIPIISIAKRLDEIFFPDKSESILLPKTSGSLRIIQQIRDEAHRFAITFHRLLRDKRTLHTELTDIKGIGQKIANKLLSSFGSVDNIKNATISELENAIGKKKAQIIALHLNKNS
jgi:excinuclease ABC subunit C